jgi:hypothetical protein
VGPQKQQETPVNLILYRGFVFFAHAIAHAFRWFFLALYRILWVRAFDFSSNEVNYVDEVIDISVTSISFFC